jgi:hypothetical protein
MRDQKLVDSFPSDLRNTLDGDHSPQVQTAVQDER